MNVTGKLTKKLEVQKGTSKAGKEWKKQSFIVETDEQYNNLYCFELFGKIEQLEKFKENDTISVDFNVNCNEYKGRYYTTLQAWRLENKGNDIPEPPKGEKVEVEETNDLPF